MKIVRFYNTMAEWRSRRDADAARQNTNIPAKIYYRVMKKDDIIPVV